MGGRQGKLYAIARRTYTRTMPPVKERGESSHLSGLSRRKKEETDGRSDGRAVRPTS